MSHQTNVGKVALASGRAELKFSLLVRGATAQYMRAATSGIELTISEGANQFDIDV